MRTRMRMRRKRRRKGRKKDRGTMFKGSRRMFKDRRRRRRRRGSKRRGKGIVGRLISAEEMELLLRILLVLGNRLKSAVKTMEST